MKIYKDIQQGTKEWHEVRDLILTASNAQAIGNNGTGLLSLVRKLVARHFTKEETYINENMERGIELEGLARGVYELENGVSVERVGFIEGEGELKGAGCSPDGLVGKDGGLEIKCPSGENYIDIVEGGLKVVNTKYIWQVQMSLLITGRKWWDLMFYHPDFPISSQVFRITPNETMFGKLIIGIKEGKKLIKNLLSKLTK